MIKAKQEFFWTTNLKGHGFHGGKPTMFYLTSEYYWLSVLPGKLNLFSWNWSSASKVMAIWMYDAENVEFKFSWLRRHLNRQFIVNEGLCWFLIPHSHQNLNCLKSGVDYSWFMGNDTGEE